MELKFQMFWVFVHENQDETQSSIVNMPAYRRKFWNSSLFFSNCYCKFWSYEYFFRPKPDNDVEIWLLMGAALSPLIRSLSGLGQRLLFLDKILWWQVMQLHSPASRIVRVIFMGKMLILLAPGSNMIHLNVNVQCYTVCFPSSMRCW